MTITTCPKCGSFNITTAGVCANCGWLQFARVTVAGESKEVIYNFVGELEIKVTGKALLDDYKRLLFENQNLTDSIAELVAERDQAKSIVSQLRDFLYDYTELHISTNPETRWWALVDKFDELVKEVRE